MARPLPDQAELRRRLKAARNLAGLSAAELAKRLPADAGISHGVLKNLEAGVTPLKPEALVVLAAALGVSFHWFTAADDVIRQHAQERRLDPRYDEFAHEMEELREAFNRRLEALEHHELLEHQADREERQEKRLDALERRLATETKIRDLSRGAPEDHHTNSVAAEQTQTSRSPRSSAQADGQR